MLVDRAGQHVPKERFRNLLIRSLSAADLRLISPNLTQISVSSGETMFSPARPLTRILFPETLVVSFREDRRHYRGPQVGIVGREGMVGWSLLVEACPSPLTGMAEPGGGSALAIDAAQLREAFRASPTLHSALLRFVHNLMTQMAGTIASNTSDSIEQRVARWLLMLHDRSDGDQLRITHDHVSLALNVRRATVTDCFHVLEGDGLLRCVRGTATVRDRAGLERAAGESYGRAENQYVRDIAPFGRIAQLR